MVVPGSGAVRQQAEAEGIARALTDAGFEWRQPGCSMCLAMNDDVLAPGERCASTTNRNFEGRQGRAGRTHLMSPAMAAAAALAAASPTYANWSLLMPDTTLARIEAPGAPLPLPNLDTDQIMPKQFLRIIDKAGLDRGLFYDLRFDEAAGPGPGSYSISHSTGKPVSSWRDRTLAAARAASTRSGACSSTASAR